jgi:hypothetical protein
MQTDVKCFPFQAVLLKTGTYFHKFFINSNFYTELFFGYGNNSELVNFPYTFLQLILRIHFIQVKTEAGRKNSVQSSTDVQISGSRKT